MGCTVCGSNASCGCGFNQGQQAVLTNPLCADSSRGSCCQPVVCATPKPFYNCAPVCEQSHQQNIYIQQFSADIKVGDSWNVPACGLTAAITVVGLKAIVVGSYIWNPGFGYFEITAFNSGIGQITITNHCTVGNATAGTNVPACTEFTVTVPPTGLTPSTETCVAIDFTAPANGDCIDITLTNTNNIQAGDIIQIGSGFYFLSTVKPNDIVTICNTGDGITPGTSVIALDANGNFQYCISIISENPCGRTPQTELAILGCDGDGLTTTLGGNSEGWVATYLGDLVTNGASYRPLGVTEACTTLSADLNIVNGTATYTNFGVSNSNAFSALDKLEFNGYSFIFTITAVPDGAHLTGTISPVPSSSFTIPSGTVICAESCCKDNENAIAALKGDTRVVGVSTLDIVLHTLVAAAATFTTPTISFSIVNSDPVNAMHVLMNFSYHTDGQASVNTGDYINTETSVHYTVNGGPDQPSSTFDLWTFKADMDSGSVSTDVRLFAVFTIAAGATTAFTLFGRVHLIPSSGASGTDAYAFSDNILAYAYTTVQA